MGFGDLRINGSYLAYLYVVLLQISVLYLQRPDLYRRKGDSSRLWPDFYAAGTGFIATGVNWFSWLFSGYVAKEFGIANGALFFFLGMGSSIAGSMLLPPHAKIDHVAHIISIPATVLLVRAVLRAIGIQTGI